MKWQAIKEIGKWPFEEKFAWILAIGNLVLAYFNNVSVLRMIFFQGLWAILIFTIIGDYLKNIKFDPETRTHTPKLSDIEMRQKTERQRTRIISFVIILIFGIEFLSHVFYKHSIVDVLKAFTTSSGYYED
jgi:uncharacterized membrane protein